MNCGVCGEEIPQDVMGNYEAEVGEFFDLAKPDDPSILAHADCGINAGLEIA
jgi:hypothetical protein